MVTTLRIATFNRENFDDPEPAEKPALDERIAVMRPQLERLRADVLCLQEVNSQQQEGVRAFAALDQLIAGTTYARGSTGSPRPSLGRMSRSRSGISSS